MEYKVNKQLSEFDSFLLKNNQQPTPRRSNLAAYPFKNQQPNGKANNMKQNQPLIQNKSRSPARSASRKTLNTHQESENSFNHQNPRVKSRLLKTNKRHCQNHEQIQGNYHITIQGQALFYCQKCANKLKNQGFPVKLELSVASSNRSNTAKSTQIQNIYPHLLGHPQFQTLQVLLQKIYAAEVSLKRSQEVKFDILMLEIQAKFLSYMQNLEEIIREKKTLGLSTIRKIRQDYENQFYTSERLFEGSLKQLQTMKSDIQCNIQSIVGEVDESTFEQCVQNYNQRLDELNKISRDRTEKIAQITKKQRQIDLNFSEDLKSQFQQALNGLKHEEISGIGISQHLDPISSGKSSYQLKGAFRNLFELKPGVQRKRGVSKR